MQFTWDRAKARANLRKHRVSFEEATTVFGDPLARIFDDPDHSLTEKKREIIIGHSTRERLLLVSYVEHGEFTRIISARRSSSHELRDYENNI
jgi:uncharacterized DUF497 family protein